MGDIVIVEAYGKGFESCITDYLRSNIGQMGRLSANSPNFQI